jgi:hypothetical protein
VLVGDQWAAQPGGGLVEVAPVGELPPVSLVPPVWLAPVWRVWSRVALIGLVATRRDRRFNPATGAPEGRSERQSSRTLPDVHGRWRPGDGTYQTFRPRVR